MGSSSNGRRHQSPSSSFTPAVSSNVPFSWETLPGVPKSISGLPNSPFSTNSTLPATSTALPLPPHLHGNSLRGFLSMGIKRRPWYDEDGDGRGGGARFVWDPFAIALAECSKERGVEVDSCHKTAAAAKVARHRKSARRVETGFGFWRSLELYGSCKTAACSVVESTGKIVSLPTRSSRSRSLSTSMPAYRLIGRRLW